MKYITSKVALFSIIAILLLSIVSCQTGNVEEYVRPDFTDSEILNNEIERIIEKKDENVLYSLWISYLLYEETQSVEAKNLFDTCFTDAYASFNESIQNEKWYDAVRIAHSLNILDMYLPAELKITFDSTFNEKLNDAISKYQDLAQLKTETEVIQSETNIPTLITGVVTIWVDLGVRVERGLGYPNIKLGSGFFIDERGYIITNHHVIEELVDPEYEGYSRLYIKLSSDNETRIPAKVVGWDKALDLALLKTEITPPYVYSLGTSQNLDIGNPIYAIGSPVGLENTITSGIISAFDRQLLSTAAVMQIDAAINSGNSGGPLIDVNGGVQGIVFAGLSSFQGLNFAIPVEYLKAILLRLYSEGDVNHTWIGAYGKTIKRYPTDESGVGVEVLYVMPTSPAYRANIKAGDIITAINGIKTTSVEELQYALIHSNPNSIVTIETIDNIDGVSSSRSLFLTVRPDYPGFEIYKREPTYKMMYPIFGLELIPSSVGNRNQYTVQSIVAGSIAAESGFSVHDPVEIRKTQLSENEDAVFIETFTRKRKSGYFEVNVAIGAALDSPYLF